MAKHDELLQQGPREAPDAESVEEVRKRIVRPAGLTLAGIAGLVVLAVEVLPLVSNAWWAGLPLIATGVAGIWSLRHRIREWWENQP